MTELLIEILNEFANQNPPVNPQSGMELGMFLNRPWFDPEDDRELEAQYEQAKAAAEARGWMITEENP